MNNYCKRCRLRDGCLQKCKEAEVYEQGYNDGVSDGYNVAVDALTPNEQQHKLIIKIDGLKKIKMENKYKFWVARDGNGELYLYNENPKYYNNLEAWFVGGICSKLDNNFFQNLTWKDEPIEVELRPVITDLDAKAQEYANNVTDNKDIRELIINAFKAGYNS